MNAFRTSLALAFSIAAVTACTPGGDMPGGSGGTSGTATGGAIGSGGASSGGNPGSGGSTNPNTGGAPNIGGSGGMTGSGGRAASGGAPGSGGASGTGGSNNGSGGMTAATGGRGGTASGGMSGGTGGSGTGGRGGAPNTGGAGGTSGGGLPALTVSGNKLQDPAGKTIILRGSSLIDIGTLYAYGGNNISAVTGRLDKIAAAGVQGHVVRLPVYPKINYNAGVPYCSPLPYPVGTGPGTSCTPMSPMNAADYVAKVLKPTVDYATSKNLYVIIDHHQMDDATKGTSAADATTFWTDIAPRFANYTNVLYEPFNEPIDNGVPWTALKPVVQGWINTIRAAAPNNIIIVPSMVYCQKPGDAATNPPTGTNLMYTAHVYPGNWNTAFRTQVTNALTRAPVFVSEWGYIYSSTAMMDVAHTNSTTWGTDFRAVLDGNGASWTSWVTDNGWTPNMFTDAGITQLSDFGSLVKTWLAAKATSDWVQ